MAVFALYHEGRISRMQGWKSLPEGEAIIRVRKLEDPLVAASYLTFASLLGKTLPRVGSALPNLREDQSLGWARAIGAMSSAAAPR